MFELGWTLSSLSECLLEWSVPVLCQYGKRTDTVSVSVYTIFFYILHFLSVDKTNTEETEALKTSDNNFQVLFNLNLKVEPGQLIGIAGAVGSGKSSVISGKPTYLPTYLLSDQDYIFKYFFYCSHCWRIETFIWKISNSWTSCVCTTTGTYTLFRNKSFFSL